MSSSMPEGGFGSVEVLSPIKKGEGAFSAHVAYDIVSIDASSSSTTVSRRYSDFVWMFDRFSESYPECLIPPLPPKGMLGRFEEDFINERMRFLQLFLTRCIKHEVLGKDENLGLFLRGSDSDLSAAQKEVSKMKGSGKKISNFFRKGSKAAKNMVSKAAERDKTEQDEKVEELMSQAVALEYALGAVVANTDSVVEKGKEVSKVLDTLSKDFESTSRVEAEQDSQLSNIYTKASELYANLRDLEIDKTNAINTSFREGIKDQQLMAVSMQHMLKTQQRSADALFEAKQRLSQLQDKKAGLEGDGGKADKLAAVEKQMIDAETAVMKHREDLESVGQRCFSDAESARREREVVVSAASVALADAHIKHAREAMEQWEKVLSLAQEVAGGTP